MPRTLNPGSIKTGPGTGGPTDPLVLTGAGITGLGPNVGLPGPLPPEGLAGGSAGLAEHLKDPLGAHQAVAISVDGHPGIVSSANVEGALDELATVVPPEPPQIGKNFRYMTLSGIPDWGPLKLGDASAYVPYSGSDSETGANVYPYYWSAPSPTTDAVFMIKGQDPITDPIWNGSIPNLVGGSSGLAKAAGFTVDVQPGSDVERSRILPTYINNGVKLRAICLSGMVYPADRGVLALLHWPPENTTQAFTAQDLLVKCVAAILLGQGIMGENCFDLNGAELKACDGDPGGIFSIGLTNGVYDPFAYPGRATGQYNLKELHTGLSDIDGSALPAPWNVGHTNDGAGAIAAGQVRLASDLNLGAPTAFGIPVLGAGQAAYNAVPPDQLWATYPTIGSTVLVDSNFFRYRLPYLTDYSSATGMKYTPRGENARTTRETARYLTMAAPYHADAAYAESINNVTYLKQGGGYPNFSHDYWNWQIARFRHTFYIPGSTATGVNLGSYWLVHFKTERDFESCVRDGVMPWDQNNGYEVYGARIVSPNLADDENTVNQDVTDTAPDYGYASPSYHVLRPPVVVGASTVPTATTSTWTWAVAANPAVMWVSGVAYFVPTKTNNAASFWMSDLDAVFRDAWPHGYRMDVNALTGDPAVAPAQISSADPVFVGVAPFSWGAGTPTYTLPAGFTDGPGKHHQRIEIPFNYAGSNGSGVFSEANGPLEGDDLTLNLGAHGTITFSGDLTTPAFSSDAAPRVFVRRPLCVPSIQPYAQNIGHGTKLTTTNANGATVLFHSTSFNVTSQLGVFGNFVDGNNRAYAGLMTSAKDTTEYFLDEVYRYHSLWWGGGGADVANLVGPGMQAWNAGPINVPVQAGLTQDINFALAAWVQINTHLVLPSSGLQVRGLPDRNPEYADGLTSPFPSAGLLAYPKIDYTTGYKPDDTELPVNTHQPDYSAAAGLRTYVRGFDAAFARSLRNVAAAGQPFVVLRIDGLTLDDFAFQAPGPGAHGANPQVAGVTGIAVSVKVPGLTTWMDLGRSDGDGPSKQDPNLDGAGCLVTGPRTFSSVDHTTGMVYCQMEVHVGPGVNLAEGVIAVNNPNVIREVPVLVKVTMQAIASDYDMTQACTSPGQFGASGPGVATELIRGIVGIRVVHPDDVEVVPV